MPCGCKNKNKDKQVEQVEQVEQLTKRKIKRADEDNVSETNTLTKRKRVDKSIKKNNDQDKLTQRNRKVDPKQNQSEESKRVGVANNNKTKKKLLIRNHQCPGDVLMLSAAIRDLHKNHPNKFVTGIDTTCKAIFEHNPYISAVDPKDPDVFTFKAEYPLIHKSNTLPYHFIHGFMQHFEDTLGVKIKPTAFKGDIHITEKEKSWISQVQELGIQDNFWIINVGGKYDYTSKWTNPDYLQEVVDYFAGKITFVQTGESKHFHPKLKNVINLIGKTDLRQYLRLIYHSVGVLCPVTFAMHAAAAVPTRPGMPKHRACVVWAGGREPASWEAYNGHRYISNIGSLDCCSNGGCWVGRCQKVYDGDEKDSVHKLCRHPVEIETKIALPQHRTIAEFQKNKMSIPKCMEMIKPDDIIRNIEYYYEGGALEYGSTLFEHRESPKINQVVDFS